MSSFMDRFMGRKPTPAQSAKDRLKFVLVTDRTTISPEDLRKMQDEILDVIRKYCRVNEDAVDMKFEQRDRENYLVADIPLTSVRPDDPAGSVRIQTSITSSDDGDEDEKKDDDKAEKPADDSTPSDDEEATKPAKDDDSAEESEDETSDSDAPASDKDEKKDGE